MDLDGGHLRNGTGIFGYGAHRGSNQKWEFIGATEFMLGRQIQVPGPERVVEKIIPGLERVVEKMVLGPERVVEKVVPGPERVVERIVPGPERVVEKIVIKFEDNPEILEELRELRAQISRAMGGREMVPKVTVYKTAGGCQSRDDDV